MLDEIWSLFKERRTTLHVVFALFIAIVVWLFGYIFSRGRIPPDHPNGNNEDLEIPLWHKEKDD